MNKKIRGIIEITLVVVAFIFFSYLVKKNLDFFQGFIGNGIEGVIIFMLIEISSIVIAPVTTVPLVPIASTLWGWQFAVVICVFSWTVGALIAFVIGRKYGVSILKKFFSLKKVHDIEKRIPREHLFWSVILLRVILPTDVVSYVLGIFTKMKKLEYTIATAIGVIPLAIFLSVVGSISVEKQILLFLLIGISIIIAWIIRITCIRCLNFFKK